MPNQEEMLATLAGQVLSLEIQNMELTSTINTMIEKMEGYQALLADMAKKIYTETELNETIEWMGYENRPGVVTPVE